MAVPPPNYIDSFPSHHHKEESVDEIWNIDKKESLIPKTAQNSYG